MAPFRPGAIRLADAAVRRRPLDELVFQKNLSEGVASLGSDELNLTESISEVWD